MTGSFDGTFLRTLIEDVLAAWVSTATDTDAVAPEPSRRNAVRATFAAVEGMLWIVREHVLEVSKSMNTLTPLASMALREETYVVANDGTVMRQVRSVPLGHMIRLIENQARLITADIHVRYDHAGWGALQAAQKARNRITHPKTATDLKIDDAELAMIKSGFNWLLATTEYVMASVSLAHRQHAIDLKAVVDDLITGDPKTLQAYERALAASGNDD